MSLERAEKLARLTKTESLLASIEPARELIEDAVASEGSREMIQEKILQIKSDMVALEVELNAKRRELERVKSEY